MKVDQEKAQNEIEAKKRDEALVDKFMANSKKENEVCLEKWRVEQSKKLMTEYRRAKEEFFKKKKGEEIARAQQTREAAVPQKTEDDKREARLKKLAQREENLEHKIEKRGKHTVLCSHLLNQILEVVEVQFLKEIKCNNFH